MQKKKNRLWILDTNTKEEEETHPIKKSKYVNLKTVFQKVSWVFEVR